MTLASGLVAAIPQIAANPGSAVTLLATQLPAASTFFLTYFVTSSLAAAAGGLLRIVPLIIYYVKLYILGSTPRAVYGIKFSMGGVAWGTLFPNMTLLTVIGAPSCRFIAELELTPTFAGLSYSVIAPLISGFAFLAFVLFWFVYKVCRRGTFGIARTVSDAWCSTSSSGSWTSPPRARRAVSFTPRLFRTSLWAFTSVSSVHSNVTGAALKWRFRCRGGLPYGTVLPRAGCRRQAICNPSG